MDGDVCKIKKILEHNSSEFDEHFIQFLLQDSQNLKQLSKLINELEKVKASSNYDSLIDEPSRPESHLILEFDVENDFKTDSKSFEKHDVAGNTVFFVEKTKEQKNLQIF